MSYTPLFDNSKITARNCQGTAIDFSTNPQLATCTDLCPASVPFNAANVIRLQQFAGGVCTYFDLPLISGVDCSDSQQGDFFFGSRDGVPGYYKSSEQRRTARADATPAALVPTSDYVILLDNSAGAVAVTLTTPAACDPSIYHLKLTTVAANEVTVTPASGTIEGGASVTFSTTVGLNFKSSMHVFFDGTNWHIL